MAKTKNHSVRFEDGDFAFICKRESLKTAQQVVSFLLGNYIKIYKVEKKSIFLVDETPINGITKKEIPFIDEPPQYEQPKNKFTQSYFEKIIMNGGCIDTEDHKMFIEAVNESGLPDFVKKQLINSSRVIQS